MHSNNDGINGKQDQKKIGQCVNPFNYQRKVTN